MTCVLSFCLTDYTADLLKHLDAACAAEYSFYQLVICDGTDVDKSFIAYTK